MELPTSSMVSHSFSIYCDMSEKVAKLPHLTVHICKMCAAVITAHIRPNKQQHVCSAWRAGGLLIG